MFSHHCPLCSRFTWIVIETIPGIIDLADIHCQYCNHVCPWYIIPRFSKCSHDNIHRLTMIDINGNDAPTKSTIWQNTICSTCSLCIMRRPNTNKNVKA